jgi:hypothetical protein
LKRALAAANQKITYVIGLPAVGIVGPALVGHFQSMSVYRDKVKAEAVLQISAAEKTFTDVSTSFSKAIALQQILLFNYLDAVKGKATATNTRWKPSRRARPINNATTCAPACGKISTSWRAGRRWTSTGHPISTAMSRSRRRSAPTR